MVMIAFVKMAKALRLAFATGSKLLSGNKCNILPKQSTSLLRSQITKNNVSLPTLSRAHSTLLSASSRSSVHKKGCRCPTCSQSQMCYSTEVDKEISKFLEKEIQFETSRASSSLPNVQGFEIQQDGGDVTLTKTVGSEKITVRLSVNGAVDSIMSDNSPEKQDEPPQMVCRPPFEVEINKGDGTVLAMQCAFPSQDQMFEDTAQGGQQDQIDDQFEIQEVAIHGGEWKDTTFSVAAATMDAELFDLLMDMLDERGVNDEFIVQLVDYCTAYENKQYIKFLEKLKSFADK